MLVTGNSTDVQSRVVDLLLAQPELTSAVRGSAGGRVIEWRTGEATASAEVAASVHVDADPVSGMEAVEQAWPGGQDWIVASVPAPVLSSGLVLIDAPSDRMLDRARAVLLRSLLETADAMLFVVSAIVPLGRAELAFLQQAAERMEHVIIAIATDGRSPSPWLRDFAEQITQATGGTGRGLSIIQVSLPGTAATPGDAGANPADHGLAVLRAQVREAESAVVAARVGAALRAAGDVAAEDSRRLVYELDAVRAEAADLEARQRDIDRQHREYLTAMAGSRQALTENARRVSSAADGLEHRLGVIRGDLLDSLYDRLRGTDPESSAAGLTGDLVSEAARASAYLEQELARDISVALQEGGEEPDLRIEGYRPPDLAEPQRRLTAALKRWWIRPREVRAALEEICRILVQDFRALHEYILKTVTQELDYITTHRRQSLSDAARDMAETTRARGSYLATREQELQSRLQVYQELSAQAEALLRRVAALSRPATLDSPGESGPPHDGGGPEKYMVGECPGQVRAGAEFSLIVSFTDSPADHAVSAALTFPPAAGPDIAVTLVVLPDVGLQALGDLQQAVTVPRYGDSTPARFAFRARAAGLSRIKVTAWLGGTFLAALRLEVSAEDGTAPGHSQRRAAPLAPLQGDPGEVTLQVHFDGVQYSFQLLSQRHLFGPVLARSLTEKPGEAVERTIAMLRKMARGASGYSPANAARWVRATGIGLWQDLVPEGVREQFWQLHDSITSFTIASDKDPVPWELLYPATPDADAGFLVEQFPVLRRVYGQSRSPRIWLGGARYVVPPDPPSGARGEVAAIGEILCQPPGEPIADLGALLDLLETGAGGMLHFACHSSFSAEAGGASIKMDGGSFVPELLRETVTGRCLAGNNPLVFINACRTATATAEYTQMISWASQFMAAGAGAFIGTLWPVRSTQATSFATAFYSALAEGSNLGQAALTARQAAKDDGDPTWLAYTAYGDPAAYGSTVA
jgi:hypothetical protein